MSYSRPVFIFESAWSFVQLLPFQYNLFCLFPSPYMLCHLSWITSMTRLCKKLILLHFWEIGHFYCRRCNWWPRINLLIQTLDSASWSVLCWLSSSARNHNYEWKLTVKRISSWKNAGCVHPKLSWWPCQF